MGYILVGSLTRLKTLVYKINGAEYIKVYIIKHNWGIKSRRCTYACRIILGAINNLCIVAKVELQVQREGNS